MTATEKEIQQALYGRKKGGRIKVAPPEQRTADGIVFASKHEMETYLWLKSSRCSTRSMNRCGLWRCEVVKVELPACPVCGGKMRRQIQPIRMPDVYLQCVNGSCTGLIDMEVDEYFGRKPRPDWANTDAEAE